MNKYEWIEAVMASKLNGAVKVFAFGLFKHMDKKGECYPGDKALMEVTGMARGHFNEYRRVLQEGGWVEMETRKTQNGNSYYYNTPKNAPSGEQSATPGGIQSATSREESATSREQSATRGEQSATTGGMNTVNNTTKNTVSNTDKPLAADAPNVLRTSRGEEDMPIPSRNEPMEARPALLEINKKGAENLKGLLKATGQRTRDERETGRAHLEDLLEGKPELAEEARSLFEDNEWRPDRKGVQRAAWAVMTVESTAREEAMKRGA